MKKDENIHFERVLNIAEKSIEAWAKTYNKLNELTKEIERLFAEIIEIEDYLRQKSCKEEMNTLLAELKEHDNLTRQKPCLIETFKFGQFETKLLDGYEKIQEQQTVLFNKLEKFEKNSKDIQKIEKQVTLWLKLATGAIVLIGSIIGLIASLHK